MCMRIIRPQGVKKIKIVLPFRNSSWHWHLGVQWHFPLRSSKVVCGRHQTGRISRSFLLPGHSTSRCCTGFPTTLQWHHVSVMMSQITSNSTLCSTACSGEQQITHQTGLLSGESTSHRAINGESVSMSLYHHEQSRLLSLKWVWILQT